MYRNLVNRTPVNRLGHALSDVQLKQVFDSSLVGFLQPSIVLHVAELFSVSLAGSLRAAEGLILRHVFDGLLSGAAVLTGIVPLRQLYIDALEGTAADSAHIRLQADVSNSLTGSALSSLVYRTNAYYTSSLEGFAQSSAKLRVTVNFSASLVGTLSVEDIQELHCVITGEIPPGARLIIDSDNYTVVLDDGTEIVNRIAWHRGDWIYVDSYTKSIRLASAGSTAKMEVMFVAKYL